MKFGYYQNLHKDLFIWMKKIKKDQLINIKYGLLRMCYLNNNKLLVWIKHDKKDFFDLIFHKICFIIHMTARGVFKMKKKIKA